MLMVPRSIILHNWPAPRAMSHIRRSQVMTKTSTVVDDTDLLSREHAGREARYRNAVEQVNEVIFEVDAEGRWIFLNPAWTRITGYTVEESLGRPFVEQVEEDD